MKKSILIIAATFIFSPIVFSDEAKHVACEEIAKACKAAGYKDENKKFWHDCMKPLILGKKVNDVSVEATHATACREKKITELQQELKEFQSVK